MTSLLKKLSMSIKIHIVNRYGVWIVSFQIIDRIRRQSWASCEFCSHRRHDATRQLGCVASRRRCVLLGISRKIENWTCWEFIECWLQKWKLGHDYRRVSKHRLTHRDSTQRVQFSISLRNPLVRNHLGIGLKWSMSTYIWVASSHGRVYLSRVTV